MGFIGLAMFIALCVYVPGLWHLWLFFAALSLIAELSSTGRWT